MMNQVLKFKVRSILDLFSIDKDSLRFKKHLRKKTRLRKTSSKTLVMIEFEQSPENVIALSIFLPIYRETSEANFAAYQVVGKNKISHISNKLRFVFSTTSKIIGKQNLQIRDSKKDKKQLWQSHWQRIVSKEDLEEFVHLDIRIGDLIYDEYLSRFSLPTINLQDTRLEELFYRAIEILEWWDAFYKKNMVEAIIVSHDVYLFGVPARFCISKNIPVFLVSSSAIVKLSPGNERVDSQVSSYHEDFLEFDIENQAIGVELARDKLNGRLKGIGDLYYMPLAAFGTAMSEIPVLKKSNRPKILVAMHDFYDSPHGGSIHFYPDFYEWLYRLGEIAHDTNYDWYIKTHPFLRGRGREILKEFTERFPKFKLLPSDVTHNQLISEGIDLALTVYGTIATEYPLFGIPVLNASSQNPHRGYNFSVTPKDRSEYEDYLRNFDLIPKVSNTEEIFEYYFMHHISKFKNWIFLSHQRYILETGFGMNPMTRRIYGYFLSTENLIKQSESEQAIRNFLKSKESYFSRGHFHSNPKPGKDIFW